MNARDTITRYCIVQGAVGDLVFAHGYAADCFCNRGGLPPTWESRTDEQVIEFIEDAVVRAIAKKTGMRKRDVRASLERRAATVAP